MDKLCKEKHLFSPKFLLIFLNMCDTFTCLCSQFKLNIDDIVDCMYAIREPKSHFASITRSIIFPLLHQTVVVLKAAASGRERGADPAPEPHRRVSMRLSGHHPADDKNTATNKSLKKYV